MKKVLDWIKSNKEALALGSVLGIILEGIILGMLYRYVLDRQTVISIAVGTTFGGLVSFVLGWVFYFRGGKDLDRAARRLNNAHDATLVVLEALANATPGLQGVIKIQKDTGCVR